jgi:hypothetical protein
VFLDAILIAHAEKKNSLHLHFPQILVLTPLARMFYFTAVSFPNGLNTF